MENMQFVIQRKDSDNHLEHHGVKGQKWGVRRYQNEDGSLTAEGQRQREKIEKWYNSGSGKLARSSGERKGLSGYDMYKASRTGKGAGIGWFLAGPMGAVVGGYVSNKRVNAGKEFFESEIARLDKQSKQA